MSGPAKATYAELERQVRILKARELEREERQEGSFDAEGIAGRPALVILRDKNWPQFTKMVDDLPNTPFLKPRGFENDPNAPTVGFWGAVEIAQTVIPAHADMLSIAELGHPLRVRDRHNLRRAFLTEPYVFDLLRKDFIGFRQRMDLKVAVESFCLAPSAVRAFAESQETKIDPVEAERRRAFPG